MTAFWPGSGKGTQASLLVKVNHSTIVVMCTFFGFFVVVMKSFMMDTALASRAHLSHRCRQAKVKEFIQDSIARDTNEAV